MSYGVKSLDKEERDAGTERCSSTSELLMNYIESNSGRMWSATESVELYKWLGLIKAFLNPNSGKEDEVSIPNSVGLFLKAGMQRLRRHGHNGLGS